MEASTKGNTSPTQIGPSRFDQLRSYLKAAYRILYKAVQPVPCVLGKLYCVNEVFVEGCIEVNNVPDRPDAQEDFPFNTHQSQNEQVKSFRDIFDDNIVSSKRVILEGEPGYGKSTLTLQAAYDWCEDPSSPLKEIELLILLPLRLTKGVTSIYEAIKLFILPLQCTLTKFDVKQVMDCCTRIVIVLDGYDEYPDFNSDISSDITEIIKGTMFSNYKLILCTRSGCLPRNLDPHTVRVRLTGFDADARKRYINKTADGDVSVKANKMMQIMEQNPVIRDLWQNPFFFSMFVHMVDENTAMDECNSVTRYFEHLIQCLYRHMLRKDNEMVEVSHSYTADKRRLYKLAFEGLAGKDQIISWGKDYFCQKVGKPCFNELIEVGILVEEFPHDTKVTTGLPMPGHMVNRNYVRFYHKLFAEWYAAHHLSGRSGSLFAFSLRQMLRKVNPIHMQFLFRFACGLRPSSANKMIKYLQRIASGDSCANLCFWEQTNGNMDILSTVRDMCSRMVSFENGYSQLLQRSMIQLLKTAVENQIPINNVRIRNCFDSIDLGRESLCLSSGLQLPRLDILRQLEIYFYYNTDLCERARDILNYTAKCTGLQKLIFSSNDIILLPQSIDDNDLLSILRRKDCTVEWEYRFRLLKYTRKLNTLSGKWEDDYLGDMPYDHYRQLAIKVNPPIAKEKSREDDCDQ